MMGRVLRTLALVALLLAPLGARSVEAPGALPAEPAAGGPSARPAAARGRLIVKYRDSVEGCVHCWHARGGPTGPGASDADRSLAELHSRFAVREVAPVFRSAAEERRLGVAPPSTAALRQYHRGRMLRSRARFRARSLRTPSDARLPDLHHVYLLEISPEVDPEAAAAAFRRDPHVEFAEPDHLVEADFTPNDPFFGSSGAWSQAYPDLWALQSDRLDMEPAWDVTQGEGTVVAVVDTGIDYAHRDIAGNVWSNPGEIAGNRLDDDGNGFVDDVRGWSFVTCDALTGNGCGTPGTPGNAPLDDNGHGTHVAGTIAAVGNNALGIVGVAPRARIMAVKGLNRQGQGLSSELAASLLYAAENGADVINNSWGCGFCPTARATTEAVRAAYALGVVTVFAAGNSASDVRFRSPQNLHDSKPLVVSATKPNDAPASFTSFGAQVDVAAPGAGTGLADPGILSLRSSRCEICPRERVVAGEYLRLHGTSMATPHVAGLAALLLAQRPTLSNEEVRHLIRASADDVHEPGYDLKTAAGRIDARQALAASGALEVRIDRPLNLAAVAAGTRAVTGTVAGADLDRFRLLYREEYGSEWIPITAPSSSEVRNGVLGTWDLAGLPLGWKALRLSATSKSGLEFDDVIYVGRQLVSEPITTAADPPARDPVVSESLAAWIAYYQFREGHVYVHHFQTGRTTRVTGRPAFVADVRVEGDLVAWVEVGGHPRRPNSLYVCRYDAANGACPPRRLASGRAVGGPALSGTRVAWQGLDASSYPYIVVHDLAAGARVFFQGRALRVDIDGDLVTWITWPEDPGARGNVMVYDLATRTRRQLTRTPEHELFPQVDGRRVLYSRGIDLGSEIRLPLLLYDLDAGRERVLLPHLDASLQRGALSGDRIVWARFGDILQYDLGTDTLRAVVLKPIIPRAEASISGNRLVWINPTTPDGGGGVVQSAEFPEE